MKILVDFFPILLFFVTFKWYGIYVATAVTIVAATLQVAFYWFKYRRVETMTLITLGLVAVLGGATLLFHNEWFIKWKPTAINWAFGLAFFISQFIGEKSITQRMLGHNITLPTSIWLRLNMSWVIFFILTGTANLYVAYHFDTNTWVNFKLFGLMGATLIFIILQAIYMAPYIKPGLKSEGKS
ncbi:MAG: septation protein A [Gammaproteobacteria bacterium]